MQLKSFSTFSFRKKRKSSCNTCDICTEQSKYETPEAASPKDDGTSPSSPSSPSDHDSAEERGIRIVSLSADNLVRLQASIPRTRSAPHSSVLKWRAKNAYAMSPTNKNRPRSNHKNSPTARASLRKKHFFSLSTGALKSRRKVTGRKKQTSQSSYSLNQLDSNLRVPRRSRRRSRESIFDDEIFSSVSQPVRSKKEGNYMPEYRS